MAVIACCDVCDWRSVVADQPKAGDIAEAERLCREHGDAEHFTLWIPNQQNRSE